VSEKEKWENVPFFERKEEPCIPVSEHKERIKGAVEDGFREGLVSQSIPRSVQKYTDKIAREVNKVILVSEHEAFKLKVEKAFENVKQSNFARLESVENPKKRKICREREESFAKGFDCALSVLIEALELEGIKLGLNTPESNLKELPDFSHYAEKKENVNMPVIKKGITKKKPVILSPYLRYLKTHKAKKEKV